MLVRLSRAPVLYGGLRRKTQLFSGTLYMAASSKTPPHQSKGPQKFKTPLQVSVFPGSSPLCHHTNSENPSDTTSFHSVLYASTHHGAQQGEAARRSSDMPQARHLPQRWYWSIVVQVRDVIRQFTQGTPKCNTNP
ncbi:hypothetical protein TNCV_2489641 [Trichonephila clavipes]|nr:hypothetical protein TNCV_2489641 [Trichonephila clavipes]